MDKRCAKLKQRRDSSSNVQNTKVSGKRYKNQDSMKDILSWDVQNDQQQVDYKQYGHLRSELEKYQGKIRKTAMTTESSDNYHGFIYLPQEKVYIPALPSGNCSFLDKPNYVDQEPVQIFEENQVDNRTDSKFRDIQQGSSYSQQFAKANKQELYDVLWENYQSLNNSHKLKSQVNKEKQEEIEKEERSVGQEQQQQQQQLKTQQELQTQSQQKMQLLNGNKSPKGTNKVQQQNQQQAIISQSQNQQQQQSQNDLNEQDRLKLTAELNQLLKQQDKLVKEIEYLEKSENQTKYHPLAQPVDGIRLQDREQRLKQFTSTTRDLPNSSFNTYYGKPAFGNYGAGNVHDKNSPFIAGQYLQTHNVNPHRGEIAPEFQQTYTHAIDLANESTEPVPPRHRLDQIPTKKQLDYFRKTNPFYPHPNELLVEAFRQPQKGIPASKQIKQSHPLLAQAQPLNHSISNQPSTSAMQKVQTSKKTTEKSNGNNKSVSNTSVQEKSQRSSQQQSQQNSKQEGIVNEQNRQQSAKIVDQLLSPKSQGINNKPLSSSQVQVTPQAQNYVRNQNNLNHTATSNFSQATQNQEKMDLLMKKKEKSSLIVDKITEPPQYNPLCYSLRDDFPIDPMNPPEWYFRSLHECELNPQYYRSMHKQRLNNIPFAGKKASQQHDFFDILQHHPVGADPCY